MSEFEQWFESEFPDADLSQRETLKGYNNLKYGWNAALSSLQGEQAAKVAEQEAEILRLRSENETLYTTMMAAAVEIHGHWDAHCDSEGYGPSNLMHRLERGIASRYGYDAKTVVDMQAKIAEQEARIKELEAKLAEVEKDAELLAWFLETCSEEVALYISGDGQASADELKAAIQESKKGIV